MRLFLVLPLALSLLTACQGQQAGTLTEEYHPPLVLQLCDGSSCQEESTAIVIDADVRPMYSAADSSVSCQSGSGWDPQLCPDGLTCAENCALDGIDQDGYANQFGITSMGNSIRLNYLTENTYYTNVGGRMYLTDANNEDYRVFKLKNREFTIDIDTSQLPCGLNGAVFFSEMEGDGGKASYPSNSAGAKYGTGYCDAQCPSYLRVIAGEVNIGTSQYGICCAELDIWEANSQANTYTFHSCTSEGYYPCQGTECGNGGDRYNGVCDKDGCEFGPYRNNQHDFYGAGPSFEVDSSQPVTVVTQFVTNDGTDAGDLVEMRRIYVQNGNVIGNTRVNFDEISDYDSISDEYCTDYKGLFGEELDFANKGGLKSMGDSFDRGMVLVLCLWEDLGGQMLWLDSISPPDADPSIPGVLRGPCPTDSGRPEDMHQQFPDAFVTFSNIKFGPINSTYTY